MSAAHHAAQTSSESGDDDSMPLEGTSPELPLSIDIDPEKLAEINRLVDDANNLRFVDPGQKKKRHNNLKPPEASVLPAIEAGVDETLVGTLEMVVGRTGELEPRHQNVVVALTSPSSASAPLADGKEHTSNGDNDDNGDGGASGDNGTGEQKAASEENAGRGGDAPVSPILSPQRRTGKNKNSLIDKNRRWVIDAASLGQRVDYDEAGRLARFLHEVTINRERIAALRINGIKFTDAQAAMVSACIWENTGIMRQGKFQHMVDLDCSYLRIDSMLRSIKIVLDPVKSGYCALKRLVLTQCQLGIDGTRTVFVALKNNVFLEELVMNGNGCTDGVMPEIVATLKSSSCRLKLLNLASNGLTADSMESFAVALEGHMCLREVQLNDNGIGDEGADHLFAAIRDNGILSSLNLSYCGIKECPWSGRLRIMTALAYLNLSQNSISDTGCLALCDALENCVCLRHLDLSNNLFGDRLSVKLGEVIEVNQGLQSLNLSGNVMIYECWNAIAVGLLKNETLMKLDLRHCELDLRIGERIFESLSTNNMVDVKLDMNPLPYVLRAKPRAYRRKGLKAALPINPDAAGVSLIKGQQWRETRLHELVTSKQSLVIIAELTEASKRALQEQQSRDAKRLKDSQAEARSLTSASSVGVDADRGGEGIVESSSLAVSASHSSTTGVENEEDEGVNDEEFSGAEGIRPPFTSPMKNRGASVLDQPPPNLDDERSVGNVSFTSSMLISLGAEKNKQKREIKKALDDGAENDNQGHLILTVCYGRESEVLGTIEVTHHTTYPESKDLIQPLVKEYLSGLGKLEMAATLSEHFVVLDQNGQGVYGAMSTVRTVWAEAAQNHHMIIVRPANWINLPESDDEVAKKAAAETEEEARRAAALKAQKDAPREKGDFTYSSSDDDDDAGIGSAACNQGENNNKKKKGKKVIPKNKDPNFAAESFVAFEYDDDVFGPGAADDISVISYDDMSYDSNASVLTESMVGAFGASGSPKKSKKEVKWI